MMPRPDAARSDGHRSGGFMRPIYHGRLGNNLFQYCFGRRARRGTSLRFSGPAHCGIYACHVDTPGTGVCRL